MTPSAEDHAFSQLPIGTKATFERTISQDDVLAFAQLSGDYNPLHVDATYAQATSQGSLVVHGMFLGALVSQLVGMRLPGTRALLLEESLSFKKPVRPGDTVCIEGSVVGASHATHVLDVAITISVAHTTVAEGKARVLVR